MNQGKMASDTNAVQPCQSVHSRYRGPVKYSLKCLSALVVPLLLGVFTVIITFQQRSAARNQWLQDRDESREQRLEDRNQSKAQRDQELSIANGQRDDTRDETINRYKDELLVCYIKEMGDLLEKSKGSLTADPITSILARVKTLNVLRQLEGKRATMVLRFLYESRQLTGTGNPCKRKVYKISLFTLLPPEKKVEVQVFSYSHWLQYIFVLAATCTTLSR